MEFQIKKYKNGDEKFILDVFSKTFNRQMSYKYWKWRYLDNPYINTNYINLAWDNERLAAHYALSPIQIYINGNGYNAALSMTTMTDPDYQGMGLFTKLANTLFCEYNKDLDIIFGVPNDNSVKGFTKKLDFKLIKEISMLEAKVEDKKYCINPKCLEIKQFDERFDELFNLVVTKYKVITVRNSNYLNWRFVHNPDNQYKIFSYMDDNKVLGYIVIKIYNGLEILTGDIVDILADNENVLNDLLNSAFSYFYSMKVSNVNLWYNDMNYIKTINSYGFHTSEKRFHFIVRDNSDSIKDGIFNYENWYLTMSDIDLF